VAFDAPSPYGLRPSLQQLEQLVKPLTSSERRVAEALNGLDSSWTVFVQPRVGLDRLDFLAISDTCGVCVLKVVDWEPGSARRNDNDEIETLTENGLWTANVDPRFSASRSRLLVFDQFYAMPEDGGPPTAAVRAVVIMPNLTAFGARSLLPEVPADDLQSVVGVFGSESLDASMRDIVVGLGCPAPLTSSIAKLRQQVVASERKVLPGAAQTWTSEAIRMVAENPTGQKIRRVRGAAGSGKSYGLTARAAMLAAEGKTVLMLTLNVTLANRLRLMANERCAEVGANPTLIAAANFHTFCTRVVQDAEMEGLTLRAPRGAPWTLAIVAKAEQAFEQGFEATYDAVLVDEGQDFTINWWNLLRTSVLAPEGEMLVVADPTQDIYDRFEPTLDPSFAGSDASETWIDLETSYRMPHDLLDLCNEFARVHLDGEQLLGVAPSDLPAAFGKGDARAGSVRQWIDIDSPNRLGRSVGNEVVRLLRESPTLSPADIAFVCDYHHDGVAAVKVIEAAGYPVHHIFSRNPDAPRRRRKHRFWPRESAVKGCTAHSLKGWETPALVMGIGTDERAQRLAYVAMTRVAVRPQGGPSFVSVINADTRLLDFGRRFGADSVATPAARPMTPPPPPPPATTAPPPPPPPVPVAPMSPPPPVPVPVAPIQAAPGPALSEEPTGLVPMPPPPPPGDAPHAVNEFSLAAPEPTPSALAPPR
jgi:hypothetical protein